MADAAAQLAERGDGRCAVSGALTMETAPWLWEQLQKGGLLVNATEADLTGVTDSDSAGLALLIAWRASCKAQGAELSFLALPERVVALARLTDAQAALGVVPGANAARGSAHGT